MSRIWCHRLIYSAFFPNRKMRNTTDMRCLHLRGLGWGVEGGGGAGIRQSRDGNIGIGVFLKRISRAGTCWC